MEGCVALLGSCVDICTSLQQLSYNTNMSLFASEVQGIKAILKRINKQINDTDNKNFNAE